MKIEQKYVVNSMTSANAGWTRVELYQDADVGESSRLGDYVTVVLDRKQSHDLKIGDEVRLTMEKI